MLRRFERKTRTFPKLMAIFVTAIFIQTRFCCISTLHLLTIWAKWRRSFFIRNVMQVDEILVKFSFRVLCPIRKDVRSYQKSGSETRENQTQRKNSWSFHWAILAPYAPVSFFLSVGPPSFYGFSKLTYRTRISHEIEGVPHALGCSGTGRKNSNEKSFLRGMGHIDDSLQEHWICVQVRIRTESERESERKKDERERKWEKN